MRRMVEISAFLGLSAAVHAGVMAGLGDSVGGPQAQGNDGRDRVSLQAAPESLAAMVEDWTTAPEPVARPPAPEAPQMGQPAPVTRPETAVPRPLQPPLPPMPQADARPDRQSPALPPPEPVALATPPDPPPGSTALAAASSPRPVERPAGAAPQPPPAAASAPQPAREAAGTGGGPAQGAAPAPAATAPALSAAQSQSLMSQWGARIMARIERARPRVQASGQVVLSLQVARSGQLAGVSVSRSSGNPSLDAAALSAVQRAGGFPAAPDGMTEASYGFSLPIRFR